MIHPVLTLLVASSIQLTAESPRYCNLTEIIIELTEAVRLDRPALPQAIQSPTVCDVPFYYSDFIPIAPPAVAPRVTYDWRSPVIFDLP